MSTGPFQPGSCQPVPSGAWSGSEEGTEAWLLSWEAYKGKQGHSGLERSRCLCFQASRRLLCGRGCGQVLAGAREVGGGLMLSGRKSLIEPNLREGFPARPRHHHWACRKFFDGGAGGWMILGCCWKTDTAPKPQDSVPRLCFGTQSLCSCRQPQLVSRVLSTSLFLRFMISPTGWRGYSSRALPLSPAAPQSSRTLPRTDRRRNALPSSTPIIRGSELTSTWPSSRIWAPADCLPQRLTSFWQVKRFSSSWTLVCSSSNASFTLFFS